MKHEKQMIMISLFAAAILAACQSSDAADTGKPETAASGNTGAAETESVPENVYPYDLKTYDGYTFTFLNQNDKFWASAHHILDYDEESGDVVSDAIYARNRKAEEDLDIKIAVEKDELENLYKRMMLSVTSGEDAYDAVYTNILWGGIVTMDGEYSYNLYDIPELHLNEEWWNQVYIDSATLGTESEKMLHATINYINMMGYSFGNVLFFNKDILVNRGIDMPYDAVRNGEWTYDMFYSILKDTVSLNGDDSFMPPQKGGTCIYGYSMAHAEGVMALLDGTGQYFVIKDNDGLPILDTDNTVIADAFEKIVSFAEQPGYFLMYAVDDVSGETLFRDGRVTIYQGQLGISGSEGFRQMDNEYGLLPIPKFTADQDSYYTEISQYTLALNIPLVASDVSRTGTIIDYLCYLSYYDVIPLYKESLCYKGVRDEDSIDMLDIIMNTLSADVGYLYGWTNQMLDAMCNKAAVGSNTFSSDVARYTKSIRKEIDKFIDAQHQGE